MSVLQQQSTLDGLDIRFVSDLGVNVHAQMYAWPVLQVGKTSGGKLVPIAVDADGNTAIAAGSAIIGSTLDGGPSWTTVFGVTGARFTSADASGGVASVTDAPTSGQKLVITDIEISVDTAMRVDFTRESDSTVILSVYMAANSTVPLCTRSKRKLSTADKKLQVRTSAAGNIAVGVHYYSEA